MLIFAIWYNIIQMMMNQFKIPSYNQIYTPKRFFFYSHKIICFPIS